MQHTREFVRMKGIRKNLFIILIVLFASFIFPLKLRSEFFKYINEDGNSVFVDDIGKVPPEYRKDVMIYKEKYDHLPENERLILLEKDRKESKKIQEDLIKEEKHLNALEVQKKTQREQITKEKHLNSLETKVIIKGHRILVPVTLGYRNIKIETLLLLDTGASIMLLYRDIADQLNIIQPKKAVAKMADGKKVRIQLARLSYVKVGPIKLTDVDTGIVRRKGPPDAHKGLLGMNFLRSVDYSIDYKNKIIRWKPQTN